MSFDLLMFWYTLGTMAVLMLIYWGDPGTEAVHSAPVSTAPTRQGQLAGFKTPI